ncbi:DUF6929 family protein [Lysobacter humi (ex Lee et al. 2017)]
MLTSALVRRLEIDPAAHPRGQPHISSASGLVLVGDWFYVVADDENHLITLPRAGVDTAAIGMRPLGDAPLPADPAERKRRKRDFEVLVHVPPRAQRPSMLVAWGSGSRPTRDVAYVIPLEADGRLGGVPRRVSLARLHDALRAHRAHLNIEAALVRDDELWLFSRAHAKAPSNGWFRLGLDDAVGFLLAEDDGADVPPVRFAEIDLGRGGDVPLGIGDAVGLDGGRWLLTATAEATSNTYDDGAFEGSMLMVCEADGEVAWRAQLAGHHKVEGLAFDAHDMLWMTTDADSPDVPSELRRLHWPPPGFRG